jgi:hypothetical protein
MDGQTNKLTDKQTDRLRDKRQKKGLTNGQKFREAIRQME